MRLDITSEPNDRVPELTLRRFLAGELPNETAAEIELSLASDPQLRQRLKSLREEQASFESQISFDKFSGGVARAQRDLARNRTGWKFPVLAACTMTFAMAAGFLFLAGQLEPSANLPPTASDEHNRIKGSDEGIAPYVRIASAEGEQRLATPGQPTSLSKGDRIRLGLHLRQGTGFVASVSVDDKGNATPVYPEAGSALALVPTREPTYLPESFEFTGKGRETLFVLMSTKPFTVEAAARTLGQASTGKRPDQITAADIAGIVQPTLVLFPFDKPE